MTNRESQLLESLFLEEEGSPSLQPQSPDTQDLRTYLHVPSDRANAGGTGQGGVEGGGQAQAGMVGLIRAV